MLGIGRSVSRGLRVSHTDTESNPWSGHRRTRSRNDPAGTAAPTITPKSL